MKGARNLELRVCTIIFSFVLLFSSGFLPVWGSGQEVSVAEEDESSPAAVTPWDADHIRKKPYLVYPGRNTAMTVLWQVYQTPARATIEWGTTTKYGKGPVVVRENGSTSNLHQFAYTMQNLVPGTKYWYRVINDGYSRTGSFFTAPPVNQTTLSFYGYGDTRPEYLGEPTDHNTVLAALLADLAKNPNQRQTLLTHMGDYVWNGLNEFLWDLQQFNPAHEFDSISKVYSNFPLMGVLGNHEGYDACAMKETVSNFQNIGELFRKYYPYNYPNRGRFYYSFDYGPVHFVIIDTWSYPGSTEEKPQIIDNVQINWLKRDLQASRKPWKIAMLHTPIWECLKGVKAIQDQLTPILKQGGVHLVLQGHHHYYSRAETEGPYSGMTFVTLGGGGAKLDPEEACVGETNKKWPPIGIYKVFQFARFDISGGTLTGTAIDVDGKVIDQFQITNSVN